MTISKLHSRQEQLQEQQQRGECQVSVVFKNTSPLPDQGTASHLQQLLRKQLGINITVQRVQPLGTSRVPAAQLAHVAPMHTKSHWEAVASGQLCCVPRHNGCAAPACPSTLC